MFKSIEHLSMDGFTGGGVRDGTPVILSYFWVNSATLYHWLILHFFVPCSELKYILCCKGGHVLCCRIVCDNQGFRFL